MPDKKNLLRRLRSTFTSQIIILGFALIVVIGALLLMLLFMGSSALGEKISSGKYPAYKDYTAQVFKYLPLRRFDPDKKKGNKGS